MLKSKFVAIALLTFTLVLLLTPTTTPNVCRYVSLGGWIGELDHCYTVTIGSYFLSYSRKYCVYTATSPYGDSQYQQFYREIDYYKVNQC